MVNFLVFGCVAYLLGSIPTAIWVGKRFYGLDVREHGSKNAGATNTFRVLGKKPGVIVLTVDVLKGLLAVMLPQLILDSNLSHNGMMNIKIVASIMVILGHVFPLFAGFKGGKGVATSLGVIFALQPVAAFVCLGIFLAVFLAFHFVSLGAIITAISFPLLITFVFKEESISLIVFAFLIGVAVVLTHKKNIKRLIDGCENKMYLIKKKV
ncbi:MAG: glycerol-3-phosphate 1-O-acyltransferase PlsY [Crocinitomicaceae bacterium]|jgi:glycerol-3-phosphate acyltransferase PlsY